MHTDIDNLIYQYTEDNMLSLSAYTKIAEKTGLNYHEIEELALSKGILPVRYKRNLFSLSVEEQYNLFKAKAAVIGCGGLGGYIIEELARAGVGNITACDYDFFAEHNLNRQLGSTTETLGHSKAELTAQRVKAINPAVNFIGINSKFAENNGRQFLNDSQVVVDALDNIPSRLLLADICRQLGLPLVHGAIAGWYGQVCTQFPGENTIEQLYKNTQESQGIEKEQGNLAFTPATVASLQAAETVKILLKKGDLLRNKIMFINLLDMQIDIMELG